MTPYVRKGVAMTPEKSKEPGVDTPHGGHPIEKLTVREFFAAHALTGLLSSVESEERKVGPTDAALSAFEFADAALKESARVVDVGADVPAKPPVP